MHEILKIVFSKANLLFKHVSYLITGKISSEMYDNWVNIKKRLQQLKLQVKQTENVLAFAFIEVRLSILITDYVYTGLINEEITVLH